MAAARRILSTALAASTAVSRRMQTRVLGASIAAGSHPVMSQDLFRRLHHQQIRTVFGLLQQTYFCPQKRHVCTSSSTNKDGHVDSGSLKQLESRILRLEVRSSFYKNLKWVLVGPIILTLMAISSAVNIYHGVSKEKENQKNTTEKLSNLKRRIEYLEGRIN